MLKELPKRFSLYIPTKEISKLVQEKLFELGYEWGDSRKTFYEAYAGNPIIFTINYDNNFCKMQYGFTYRLFDKNDKEYFEDYPIISIHEVLERESSKKEHVFTIKLSEIIDMFKNKASKEEGKCHCTHQ